MKIRTPLILLFAIVSCTSNNRKVIVIQPMGDFSEKEALQVLEGIKALNPSTVLNETIPFPDEAYYEPRNRYRADSLIRYLGARIGKDSVIIGLSKKDISVTKGEFRDWGVMGLGYCPGNACIVSSFRLKKNNKNEQFYKVALHELGHTQGLYHCEDKTCLMRDAEGGNPLDEEKDFCSSCKRRLEAQNWILKED
jgi:archaemetzincin